MSLLELRVIRLIVGVGIAAFIAAWFDWAVAYTAPILTAKFLMDKPQGHVKLVKELLLTMLGSVGLGILLSTDIVQYPFVMMLVIAGCMYWCYYLFTDPRWNYFAVFMLITLIILPFMANITILMTFYMGLGLLVSGLLAIFLYALVHIYFPEPDATFDGYPISPLPNELRHKHAAKALLIAFPAMVYYYSFQVADGVLFMIFVAILSVMVSGEKSLKISLFAVVTTLMGAVVASLIFALISVFPNIYFYTLCFVLVIALIGAGFYSKPQMAPVFFGVYSGFAVILGMSLLFGDDVQTTIAARMAQIVLIGVYVVFMAFFVESRQWKFLQNT